MQTPNPLPEPGWWLVINGDELYEMIHCRAAADLPPCTLSEPTDAGAYYWSVNEGEAIWTPWADVDAVFRTLAEAEAYTDAYRAFLPPFLPPFVLGQIGTHALATPPRVEAARAYCTDEHHGTPCPLPCKVCADECWTEARYVVTIRHRQGGDPYTPAMLRAVAEVLASALHAAGIEATATAEPLP